MAKQKLEILDHARRRIGVLFSGGLDSAALVEDCLKRGFEVWPVYVRSGLSWEESEIDRAQKFLGQTTHLALRPLVFATLNLEQAYDANWSRTGATPGASSDDVDVFLPARNLLLVTKSMLMLSAVGVHDIAIATLKGNPFPDARPRYFRMLEKVLSAGFGHDVRIHAPFLRKTKAELILGMSSRGLSATMSCIGPRENVHCGLCNKCAERKRAFRLAGVRDLTAYATLAGKTRAAATH